ncbi:CopG family ribbon-helix-helix protein [Escherichia coli]|uniref:CopG family ribbon-helix-helix protein n=1 Tax=Escherichia coli TaxID=562 RepID=UPI001FCE62E4|nr:hypothetical protein [Escherichia coli]
MAQVNMSLRIDAELKDAFMAAAKSMDRNGSQLIRDFMRQTVERQHNTWFRDQVEAGRQQLERGDVLPHDMVESSAAAWGRLRERAKSYAKALANDILR